MATLLFRARTVAVTSLNTEQLRRAHALNVRWLPIAGGPAGAAGERAAVMPGAATCGLRLRQWSSSPRRRNAWNRSAGARSSSAGTEKAGAMSAGLIVSPCSSKLDVFPGTPVVSWGTTRYSALSAAPAAGKTRHPAVAPVGSNDVNAPTTGSVRLDPAAVQGGSLGPDPSLHATAAATPRNESRLSRIIPLRNMFPLCHFAREAQGPPEADRADDLVDADHDHDQRLQRYPPLGKSAAGSRREAEGDPRLGDEPQPAVACLVSRNRRGPPRKPGANAEPKGAESDEEQHPPPVVLEESQLLGLEPRAGQSKKDGVHGQAGPLELTPQPRPFRGRQVLDIEARRQSDEQHL